MLAVSPLPSSNAEERDGEMVGFTDDFSLDDIDFSDLFVGFDDGDILPDLEVDPAEILAELSACGEEDSSGTATNSLEPAKEQKEVSRSEEVVSMTATKEEEAIVAAAETKSSSSSTMLHDVNRRKSSAAKNSQGKRKVKVDWTPELHRRFVQAVEQLGVDKAVPSRILELMEIDCLTRHNIASHLQKYRSHRKHLLAREAEAASWSQRRQMYAATAGAKRDVNLWPAPTIGFPPQPPPPPQVHPFRPLHVWGRPTFEAPLVPLWPPLHLAPRSPMPACSPHPPLPPLPDPSYWHNHYQRGGREGWMTEAPTHGTPCFPQPMSTMNFPPVPGILTHPIYRAIRPPPTKNAGSPLQLDAHPTKESVDAAIGDVLERPWLPLPLGLKPPSMDSVMVELQRQGISKVPPTCG